MRNTHAIQRKLVHYHLYSESKEGAPGRLAHDKIYVLTTNGSGIWRRPVFEFESGRGGRKNKGAFKRGFVKQARLD